jgi:hypothetical protein
MTRLSAFAIGLSFVASCSAPHDSAKREVTVHPETASSIVDLISPTTCTVRGTHLVSCGIAAETLSFTPFDTAVPLRTTVTAQRSGNCSTAYSLQVSLAADGQAATNFPYIANSATAVRRSDGGLISNLAVADSSPWTRFAAFDSSCRISLNISPNEVDVNSKADAQAIITSLTNDLTAKQATAARYGELLLYSKAFAFLKSVADNFLGQLTDDTLQQLRASATDAQPTLEQVITDCNSLSQDQKRNLFKLDVALGKLDHPEDWVNPDGSKKTVRDFLGPDDQKVIDTINQLAQNAGGMVDYAALYQQAQLDAANAQKKLDLATQQLASFLN